MKKGFTLIELLAVIVILAIILVLAVPKILGIIQNVRKEAIDSDAKLIIDTIKKKLVTDDTFNPLDVDETNVTEKLGISNDNYDSLSVSYKDDDIYVDVTGKNKYNGLVVCGTSKNMLVVNSGDSSECQGTEPIGPLIYHVTNETTYQYQMATTKLDLDDEDDGMGSIDFNFTFGDTTYTTLYVSTNGYITFNEDDAYEYGNGALILGQNYPVIAGYWTDLTFYDGITLDYGIYYSNETDNGENYLLVEYRNILDYNSYDWNDESTGDFEIKLYEDGEIYVYYQDVSFGESDYNNGGQATAGVYVNKTNYSRYSYNEPIINDGLALKYYLAPGEITIPLTPESCFIFDSDTKTITDYDSSCPSDVSIPPTIGGVAVENIGYEAFRQKDLTSVIIPNGVTTIEEYAFFMNSLTSITIPNTVTTIGGSAFYSNDLTSVTIPSSVTTLEDCVFESNELTSVTIPSSVTAIGDYAFAYNELTNITIPTSVTTIGISAFNSNQLPDNQAFIYARNSDGSINNTILIGYGGSKTSDVIIPSNVTTIGDSAFASIGLTSITIPNSVTTIEDAAFINNQLISVVIPSGITRIADNTFYNNQLTSITIPSGVTTIGDAAFINNQLIDVTIPNSVTTIGDAAFEYNALTSVTIPTSVTTIGNYAFYVNPLTSVTIPTSVTTIGDYAFYGNNLTSITIGNGVTSIGKASFNNNQLPDNQAFIYARNSNGTEDTTKIVSYGGSKKFNVIIPNNVTTIENYAFYNNQLTSITIPNNVTIIGNYAFDGNELISVTTGNNITTIGDFAFNNNHLTSITIPASLTTIGVSAFYNNRLTSITIPNGVTTIGAGAFEGNQLTSVIIPTSVTTIGTRVFNRNQLPDNQALIYARNSNGTEDTTKIVSYGGSKKDNIIIPNSVTTIGDYTFYYTGLISVTIPNGVTIIGDYAFNSNQLTSLTIPDSVTTIGTAAFESNQLTSLTISNSVTTIKYYTFRYNSLTSVTIPSSVTSIEEGAFRSNDDLTSVTIQGANPQRFNATWTTIGFPIGLRP